MRSGSNLPLTRHQFAQRASFVFEGPSPQASHLSAAFGLTDAAMVMHVRIAFNSQPIKAPGSIDTLSMNESPGGGAFIVTATCCQGQQPTGGEHGSAGGMQRCVRRHLHRRLVNGTPTAKASAASGRYLDRIGHQTEPTQPDVVYVARANETGEAGGRTVVYSTSGYRTKQLATPIAQKWLTKEFAAGAKTGGRPDAHTTNPRS